ncbi:unnamed protein product, partial [Brenthis ino]
MDSVTEEENRGAKIIPSARKSIHSYNNTYNSTYLKTMGKYGVNAHRRKQQNTISTPDHGVDEIDNVMSKIARPSSPLTLRKNSPKCRRNSVDIINNEYSNDESDDDEELYTSALQSEQENRNASKYSLNVSAQRSRCNESVGLHNNLFPESSIRNETKKSYNFLMAILVLFLATVTYSQYSILNTSPADVNVVYDKLKFYNDVKDLEEKYKVKYTSILQVRTGVSTIFENQDAGSFIFTYNSQKTNFNSAKFNNFIEDLAATASRYLRNESKEVHVVVDTSNITVHSVYDFMNEYREGLDKTGVMLVKDIYNIPSELAMAFHYYCDEFSPLVKKSAIFFTLNLSNCSQHDQKSTHDYIEKCLAKKWNSIEEDKIGPLLTRVVNIVIDVTATF